MEIIDKRVVDKMQEDERRQYKEEILKHLPDCSGKGELLDTNLLMSKIPLRSKKEKPQENAE